MATNSAVRLWRHTNHVTLEEAARRVGISVAHLSRIERGQPTTTDVVLRIRSYTGLTADQICDANRRFEDLDGQPPPAA